MIPPIDRLRAEYDAVFASGGFLRRDSRVLLELTGADRSAWLHNLITNQIKNLRPGDGVYAFATSLKGRCLFDLNALVLDDRIWLDLDRRRLDSALAHLNKYLISENVRISEIPRSPRLSFTGPRLDRLTERLALRDPRPMPQLQHFAFEFEGAPARLLRHDFAGLPGIELIFAPGAEAARGIAAIKSAAQSAGFCRMTPQTADLLRIEAGIPADIEDIDDEILPPETGQIERGISYHKGCYLGQEVIERMRSHGILARKLVGVRFEGDTVVTPNTPLLVNDIEVGRTRSGCLSFALGAPLSLAYVKSAHAAPSSPLIAADPSRPRAGTIVQFPLTSTR